MKSAPDIKPTRVVAILDCASGNAEVGTMWKRTATFDVQTPISEVIDWARDMPWETGIGNLTIQIDENASEEILRD